VWRAIHRESPSSDTCASVNADPLLMLPVVRERTISKATVARPYRVPVAGATARLGSNMEQPHRQNATVTPYRWAILTLGILAYATSQFSRQNYSGVQRFVAQDLHLGKGELGILASVFFYSYALFQMPWGIASDKYGSRWITGFAIFLTAGAMVGFATAHTNRELLFWRVLGGVAGAGVYASMSGGLAWWFPPEERGFSQAALGGVGGAMGECTAFFLMPVLSIHFASGWRQGMGMVAGAIAAIGILCLLLLRSAPAGERRQRPPAFEWTLLRDPRLWCYTFLFSAFIVGIRGTQTWMVVYASDVYLARGADVNSALIAGGLMVTVAYSLLGRGIGCPLAGKLSDLWIRRGSSRTVLVVGWLLLAIILLQLMANGVTGTLAVAVIATLLGTSMNLFPLVTASISDTYGAARTGSIVGFVNMVAQLCGATALAVSGYLGVALSAEVGNGLDEYRGIWLAGMGAVALLTALGALMALALRMGWSARPSPA
jgi:MFS family permease